MCEVIIYGDPQLQTYNDGWTADKKNSLVYLKTLESFEFIFCLITLQRSLTEYLKLYTAKSNSQNNRFGSFS